MSKSSFVSTVKDFSSRGLGVVDHPDGIVFFVPGVFPGDRGEFEILSQKKRYGFAKLVKLLEASLDRVENPCPHYGFEAGQCGGCPWLGYDYSKQLEQKQNFVKQQLQFKNIFTEVNEVWPSEKELGYRNRAQLKTDGENIGYITPGTNVLAPIQDCIALTDKNRQLFKSLINQLPNSSWHSESHHRFTLIDIDDKNGILVNQKNTFRQANDEQNRRMQQWLTDQLKKESREIPVLELFCGSGNFTKVLIENGFDKLIAVEGHRAAVNILKDTFGNKVTAMKANLFEPHKWSFFLNEAKDSEILVLDPPREGFVQLTELTAQLRRLRKIIYISCDVQNFCRDVEKLGAEWKVEVIQPVDQFPQTPHVELLAKISKDESTF